MPEEPARVFLVSYLTGDSTPRGADVALLDDMEALREPGIQEWMRQQGYVLTAPDECMLVSETAPGPQYRALGLSLTPADEEVFRRALAEQDREASPEEWLRARGGEEAVAYYGGVFGGTRRD